MAKHQMPDSARSGFARVALKTKLMIIVGLIAGTVTGAVALGRSGACAATAELPVRRATPSVATPSESPSDEGRPVTPSDPAETTRVPSKPTLTSPSSPAVTPLPSRPRATKSKKSPRQPRVRDKDTDGQPREVRRKSGERRMATPQLSPDAEATQPAPAEPSSAPELDGTATSQPASPTGPQLPMPMREAKAEPPPTCLGQCSDSCESQGMSGDATLPQDLVGRRDDATAVSGW